MSHPPQFMQAVIPLLIPRLADAPSFDGLNLTDFLAPDILQYCTEDVKHVMRYLPELGPAVSSWADAEEELKGLYGSEDRPIRFSIDDLRSFCAETHARQAFEMKNNVEIYLCRFMEILGSICQDGLPAKTLGEVIAKVPAVNHTTMVPPSIKEAEMRSLLEKRLQQPSRPTTPEGQKRCFVCGLSGVHPIGWRNCPTTKELFNENLVMGDPNGHLIARDGLDLPLTHDPGGIAAVLRARAHANPTHSSTASLTAQYNGRNVLGLFGVVEIPHGQSHILVLWQSRGLLFPNPRCRYQTPLQVPPSGAGVPLNEFQLDPRCEDPPHATAPPPSVPMTLLPMHPLNTEDGWRKRKWQRKGDKGKQKEESEMPDAALFTELMNAPVPAGLTIGKVIGVSPPLQKRVMDYTQRRREYVTSTGEYEILSLEVAKSAASGLIPTGLTRTNDSILEDADDGEAVAEFFTSCHAFPSHPLRYLAFATGMITVLINGEEVRCLVDTGSKLNLVSLSLVQSLGLPNDTEGTRWSLSSVNSGSDQLIGLCRNVPMRLGGHNFDHHLFVSCQHPGKQEIVLGQPWIQWYSGQIDFDRGGSMDLRLWEDGDRSHPANISVRLLKPGNERNQTGFHQGSHRAAYAEEASDDDTDFY
ncbi:hypothetical protein K438DRAFT_1959092 [Mycena galopus ATCC 62051]|nr:hypothetical protein K438DRAFT_1959092 [Mycena galopus ATCC 62051]